MSNSENSQVQMNYWYQQPLGRLIFDLERKGMAQYLAKIYGYHLLQLGGSCSANYLAASKIDHKMYLTRDFKKSCEDKSLIISKYDELPFLMNSIDVVVVPHSLELQNDPKKILSEVYHILLPEGQLIIVGFNPWSLWGLCKHFHSADQAPWNGKYIRAAKLSRWLTNTGFSIVDYKTYFFRPPFVNAEKLPRYLFMEAIGQLLWPLCGGLYIMVAKKSVLQPVKRKARRHKRALAVAANYARPATRVSSHEKC